MTAMQTNAFASSAPRPETWRQLNDLPDDSLVERARGHDLAAFEALMRRHNRRLFRVTRGVLRDSDAAQDAVQEAYLRAFFPRSEIRPYDNPTSLRSALRSGAVDALFGDGVTLALWLNGTDAEDCCSFKGGPYTESHFFGDGVGIAVKKNNVGLRRALDDALAQLAARGVYADLYLKYFPIGFY